MKDTLGIVDKLSYTSENKKCYSMEQYPSPNIARYSQQHANMQRIFNIKEL